MAGIDLITACDIRLCTQDAWFQVKVGGCGFYSLFFHLCIILTNYFDLKEVDIGLAADVGTLQRLPKVIGSRR